MIHPRHNRESGGARHRVPAILALLLLPAIALLLALPAAAAPDPEEAHYNAVSSLYNAGQWQAAVKKIEERLGGNLNDAMRARYLYARALALEQGGQNAAAGTAHAELLKKFPAAPEANLSRLALLYADYAAGRLAAVAQAYPEIRQQNLAAEERRNLAVMHGESLLAAGRHQEALNTFKEAIKLGADPQLLEPKLFHICLKLQAHDELLAMTAQSPAGIPAEQVALARAEALLARNRPAEAEAEAAKVPAAAELAPRATLVRAQALLMLGKAAAAIEPLQLAIRGMRQPAAPASAHLALAECLLQSQRQSEAEAVLSQAAKLGRPAPGIPPPQTAGAGRG